MLKTALIIAGVVLLGWIVTMGLFSLLSRKPNDLGETDGRLRSCPSSPNCVCSFDSDDQHGIKAIAFEGEPGAAWQRLKAVLMELPRTRMITESETYLHAECTSLLFRFVDDVECLLDAKAKVIHVRSASRAGRSDLGVNRARVETIRQKFEGK